MNKNSSDRQYIKLITSLRNTQKLLAKKIAEKVYEYGFLKNRILELKHNREIQL